MLIRELSDLLVALGCPADKSLEMARQLDRRARQLAEQKGRSYDQALAHLVSLMKQGWAAQGDVERRMTNEESEVSGSRQAVSSTMPREHSPSTIEPPALAMIQPWKTTGSQALGDFRVFKIRKDRRVSPRTGVEHNFVVLDAVNWVNVIAVTPDGQLVMIEQFRHGTETVELEIPGGVMDSHDVSPVAAGVRELREETGYEGENARIIGEIFPNPAIMSNTCYTVLVEDCRLNHRVQFDSGEDLITCLVPAAEIPRLVAQGRIRHSLVVVGLYYFELWQRQKAGAAGEPV